MKQIFISLTFLAFGLISFDSKGPIIIRHDVDDKKYIEFAKKLPVIDAIVLYNATDLSGTLISDQWVPEVVHFDRPIQQFYEISFNCYYGNIFTVL